MDFNNLLYMVILMFVDFLNNRSCVRKAYEITIFVSTKGRVPRVKLLLFGK